MVDRAAKVDGLGRPIDDGAEYYVQDARGYVGDFMSLWRPDGAGYTTDLADAGLYSGAHVRGLRPTDVPWRPEDLEPGKVTAVNVERIRNARRGDAAAAAELARNGVF